MESIVRFGNRFPNYTQLSDKELALTLTETQVLASVNENDLIKDEIAKLKTRLDGIERALDLVVTHLVASPLEKSSAI